MFKTKVTYSTKKDAFEAGVDAAKKASKLNSIKLSMVFTDSRMDQSKIVEGIKSVLKGKQIIGCTSSGGIITQDGFIGGDAFLGMMSFSDDDLVVGTAILERGDDPRETGKQLARAAITKAGIKKVPSYFYMVASPKDEEEYLKGIQDVIGEVPFFGGSAADNEISSNWNIICNDKIVKDGCAVAFFYAKNECKTMFESGYTETNDVGIITSIDDKRTISTIDNRPAIEKYAEWTRQKTKNLMGANLFAASILNPIGIKDPTGSILLIRHPMNGNKDLSMYVGNNIAKNTAAIKMEITPNKIIKSNGLFINKLKLSMKKKPSGYLLIHSAGRKLAVGPRVQEVYEEVKKTIGDKDFIMPFSFSEYGVNDHSAASCGNLMVSFTGFSE